MRRSCGALLLLVSASALAPAQEAMPVPWANKFIVQKDPPAVIVKDFGTVPHGTQLNHRFTITNIYAVPMQISDPRVSCGCTTGSVTKRVLQPRESGHLDVVMDARRFNGHKAVTVWVDFGPTYRSTAVIQVRANSRTDIALNPGRIDFGVVAQGRKASQSVELQYLGGAANWQLTGWTADETCPLDVAVQETGKQRGRLAYTVTASIKPDAAPGALLGQIQLHTNDPGNPIVSISVSGSVQAPFQVHPPGPLRFENVKVGEASHMRVNIQGARPFSIVKVEGEGDGFTVEVPRIANAVITAKVNFQPTQSGSFRRELRLYTDASNFVRVSVEGNAITAQANGSGPVLKP